MGQLELTDGLAMTATNQHSQRGRVRTGAVDSDVTDAADCVRRHAVHSVLKKHGEVQSRTAHSDRVAQTNMLFQGCCGYTHNTLNIVTDLVHVAECCESTAYEPFLQSIASTCMLHCNTTKYILPVVDATITMKYIRNMTGVQV